ncbi:VOC family protein [Prauserella cavernicola]|uniref:VOC family protein n=1 Tax=Prauserella cavernicola TaxID=2800127 RepID=A0A934V448_9PSEU|nr:VOC family protein [Prauserella cavernicola]MBK1783745.1 VOC family protein [Prauserella cavernicola]
MPLTSGINHVVAVTSELDRMARFYADAFDARIVFDRAASDDVPRMAIVELGGEGRYLKLVEAEAGRSPRPRVESFGLAVAGLDELAAVRERALAHELDVSEIERIPTQWILWLRDPDGARIQVCAHASPAVV